MQPVAPPGDLPRHRIADDAPAVASARPAAGADAVGRRFSRFAGAAGWTSTLVGALALVGWLIHRRLLTSFIPDGNTMKPNTAVCFVLAGAAVSLESARARVATARVLGACVAGLGGLTLAEYLSGRAFGIDRVLFSHAFAADTSVTAGRMAPSTAVAFLLIGLALVFRTESRRGPVRTTESLAIVVIFIGFMASLGYAFGAPALYRLSVYTSMALPTAVLMLLLGLAVLAARPHQGMMVLLTADSEGGALVRRLIPMTVAVEIVVGAISLALQRNGLYGPEFGLAIVVAGAAIVIAAAAWNTAMRLQVLDADRADILENLERRVEARTAELAASEERFRSIFEDGPMGIGVVSESRRFESVNAAMCKLLGYTADELADLRPLDITHPDDVGESEAQLDAMFDGRMPLRRAQKRYLTKDGRVVWVSLTGTRIVDSNGRTIILTIFEDITARRATEIALTEATQLFQSAFVDAPIGFVISSDQGVYQRVNKAMCAITGYSEAELVGRDGRHMTHPDDYARDLAGSQAMREGTTPTFLNEKRYIRRDGEVIWASIHASLLPRADGPPEHIIAQVVDVTARHRAEEALSAANDELRHANEIKDHFVAVTTHELRSPLTTIVGFAELLGDSWESISDDDRRDYIARIERQGRRLEGLVADLLTLSTVDAGGLHVDTSPVVVRAALDEATAACGIGESITCHPALVVCADPDRLQQILINLLTNARKYGAEPITVEAVAVDEARIRISVRDRGAGVPEEFVPYLFETFTQAGTGRTRRTTGSGLGLAIVSRLAVAQNGEAFYEPNPGGGSCFGVVLDETSVRPVSEHTLARVGVHHGA